MPKPVDLEEIAFDDSEAYFQEDFGTPVSDQGQAIFDPLDDIADVNKVLFEKSIFQTFWKTHSCPDFLFFELVLQILATCLSFNVL